MLCLELCFNFTVFSFKNTLYRQVFGAPMKSCISPVVANIFMAYVEKAAFNSFQTPPRLWVRFVDDTFCVTKRSCVGEFHDHLDGVETHKKRMELKHIQNVLTLNGYPNWLLNRKLKIKSDPPSATPATRNAVETRGIAILPNVLKFSEKLKLILLRHGIRTVFKPPQKLGGLLSSFKDAIDPGYRQGAIYKINCSDCDLCYIGETKRWFERRKKKHMRDVKNSDNNATALSKHAVELGHSIDLKKLQNFAN